MIDHFYESIPGWFNFQSIYAEQVASASPGAVFVEIGSWLGRSTAYMAVEIANSGKRITFYAVDTWRGSPAPQYQTAVAELAGSGVSPYGAFRSNMQRGGVDHVVCPLIGDSATTAGAFLDGSLDFVFLDAAHDFHSVRRDVRAWLPKVKVGGVLAGHDANCPGLMNAVREYVPAEQIIYTGTSWMYEVPGQSPLEEVADMLAFRHVPLPFIRCVGVRDTEMVAMADHDYVHRLTLEGFEIEMPYSHSDWHAPYIRKWGGPPGQEMFTFPYGVSTEDW